MSVVRGRRMSRGSQSRSRSHSTVSRSLSSSVRGGRVRAGPAARLQNPYFNPFPSMMRNKMRYVDNIIITTVASSDDATLFYMSCNGIFDPNISGVGHQPYGHDTLSRLYNHYRVDKAVLRMTPTTTTNQIIYGVAIVDDLLTPATDNTMQEHKTSQYRCISNTNGVGTNSGTITSTWKPDLSFPVGGGEQKNMNAAYGSNPGEQMYFACFARRPLGSLPTVSTSYNVQIDYYVTSYEMRQQEPS